MFITCDSNWGSIGRITEQLGQMAQADGWESHVVYGRLSNPSLLQTHCFTSTLSVYEHYLEHRLFDNDGRASRKTTKKIVSFIEQLNPDLVHLHNIHDHWLNYRILFEYLNTVDIPIVWTQHDCWSYTGGCGYYSLIGCDKWKAGCNKCPLRQGMLPLRDQTSVHYTKKKALFNSVRNLTLVPVSKWLENEIHQSFLQNINIKQIYNGVDVKMFHPVLDERVKTNLKLTEKRLLLATATLWSERKGLKDYVALSSLLASDVTIVLVGLSETQKKRLPTNIIGLSRTQNIQELVEFYSASDIVLNLSYEETFGLTTVEGFACGTPGIVYNSTASPELITPETGLIVEPGDIQGVANAINEILSKGKAYYSNACRQRAVTMFNKDDRFAEYIQLYEDLLKANS